MHLLTIALAGHHYGLFESILEVDGKTMEGGVFAAVRIAVYESESGLDFGQVANRYGITVRVPVPVMV